MRTIYVTAQSAPTAGAAPANQLTAYNIKVSSFVTSLFYYGEFLNINYIFFEFFKVSNRNIFGRKIRKIFPNKSKYFRKMEPLLIS
jgi:hypothetical protein